MLTGIQSSASQPVSPMSRSRCAVSMYDETKYAIPNGKRTSANAFRDGLNQPMTKIATTMTAQSATVASMKLLRFLRIDAENQSSSAA
jgi:hypothetical protein